MVERWTNGEWKSTKHRVIHQASNYRISVPFFFEPNFDAEIRPLRKCVEKTGGVPKFEPVVYGDHLTAKVRLTRMLMIGIWTEIHRLKQTSTERMRHDGESRDSC